jgi:hypothetical protein
MDVGVLNRDGESLGPRQMNASPAMVLNALAPSREDGVVAVVWVLTWDGLADLGAPERLAVVSGHAL